MLETPEGALLFLQRKEGYLDRRRSPPPSAARASPSTAPGRDDPARTTSTGWPATWATWRSWSTSLTTAAVAVASPTIVCCLPAVGVNGHGGAQGIGSLTASDDRVGVPRVLVSRARARGAWTASDAIARAGVPARAGGYGHVFAFAGGDAFAVETTGTQLAVLDGPGAAHEPLPRSRARRRSAPRRRRAASRGSTRLEPAARGARAADASRSVMDILRDHGSSPQAICLHPDPEEGDEASAVDVLDGRRPRGGPDVGRARQPVRERVRGGGPHRRPAPLSRRRDRRWHGRPRCCTNA